MNIYLFASISFTLCLFDGTMSVKLIQHHNKKAGKKEGRRNRIKKNSIEKKLKKGVRNVYHLRYAISTYLQLIRYIKIKEISRIPSLRSLDYVHANLNLPAAATKWNGSSVAHNVVELLASSYHCRPPLPSPQLDYRQSPHSLASAPSIIDTVQSRLASALIAARIPGAFPVAADTPHRRIFPCLGRQRPQQQPLLYPVRGRLPHRWSTCPRIIR
mmetsp:Transcript_28444/g.44985  ORF Transcript_28444/g.44985 Transcript_28444/m.44985 type:complete len:215 (+) Transcript_28444:491-1135(+)